MAIGANAAHEEVDAAVALDLLLVAGTFGLEVFSVAVQDVDIFLLDVDMTEEVVPHEAVVALGMVLRDADIFVHVEGDHILEGDLAFLVKFHQFLIGADRRGPIGVEPVGKPRMKGFLAVGLKALMRSTIWLAAQCDMAS